MQERKVIKHASETNAVMKDISVWDEACACVADNQQTLGTATHRKPMVPKAR